MARIGIIGAKHTTLDLARGLLRAGFSISACVTIDEATATKNEVAGYMDLARPMQQLGIPLHYAHSYALKSAADETMCKDLDLDVLLVMGWQRLIPEWWLQSLRIGAFGMHGSSKPLPHGRGRSPMNWSLIQDKDIFYTHFFRYKPGVDDGDIVGVQTFDINDYDTCKTLHYKNTTSMLKLAARHLPEIIAGTAIYKKQDEGTPTFYPKRTAEDGVIYWSDSTRALYNLVRGVTDPFPGAFTYLGGQKIMIWRAQPFDTRLAWDAPAGTIVAVFEGGDFVVKTGDGTLLVTSCEGAGFGDSDVGRVFDAPPAPRKIWENLPE